MEVRPAPDAGCARQIEDALDKQISKRDVGGVRKKKRWLPTQTRAQVPAF